MIIYQKEAEMNKKAMQKRCKSDMYSEMEMAKKRTKHYNSLYKNKENIKKCSTKTKST